ncbi:MAG: FkbM family methyltransferase, partial [bacterium]
IRPDLWSSFHPPYLQHAPEYRVASGVTSASSEHVMRAVKKYLDSKLPVEEVVEAIEVPCTRLADLMSAISFPADIHVLQVDAEGADDKVIYACDIRELKPVVVNFESMNLGRDRLADLEGFLSAEGYRVFRWSGSDTVAILGRGRLDVRTSVSEFNTGRSTAV